MRRFLLSLCVAVLHSILSLGLLLVLNWLGGPTKLSVNFASVVTSLILGTPGVSALLFLKVIYQ